MFERYTERARRVLFYARYEASQLGNLSIETEHLLLGLTREGKGLTNRILARAHLSLENIRKEVEGRTVFREKVSTSVEIPFSAECKRVLGFAAEEADRLLHNYIGTEHLLLGILREERCVAADILMQKGMRLDTVREDIVQLLNEKTTLTRDVKETPTPEETSGATLPRFLPSLVVHIAHSTLTPAQSSRVDRTWGAYGFTLRQIVAIAWDTQDSLVTLDHNLPDQAARYDFVIVLPGTEREESIPALLREAVQQQFNVDITRDDGDPSRLTVRSR